MNINLDLYLKSEKLIKCQEEISYQFKNPQLLLEALWHSSQKNISNFSYERMEFVGDAILRFYASIKLYQIYPSYQEGSLTKAISNIVSAKSLAIIGKKLNLDTYVFIAAQNNQQIPESVLSDVYESLIAAIYYDGGIEATTQFLDLTISELFLSPLDAIINFKAILSEWAQKNKVPLPIYEVTGQYGPVHESQFEMMIHFNGESYGPIIEKSKKNAEQKVAEIAIKSLNIQI